MGKGEPLIVVDNTNTQHWEMKPYLELAKKYDYKVKVVRLKCDEGTAASRNQHGVPREAVERMASRFEDYEGEEIISTDRSE
jgi:predicted kinase